MFICYSCSQPSPPAKRAHRMTLETRAKSYPYRPKANRVKEPGKPEDWRDDPGGVGFETAREALVCSACSISEPQGLVSAVQALTG